MNNKNPQKGFTIFVAVITAGVLLIVAMSIGGLALKEQTLSTANKDSQAAYYAADSGMECALYWDENKTNGGIFGPDANGNAPVASPPSGTCGGKALDIADPITIDGHTNTNGGTLQAEYSYSFQAKFGDGSDSAPCAIVTVTKDTNDSAYGNTSSNTHTTIQSYGYNTCGPSLNRLDRGVITTY